MSEVQEETSVVKVGREVLVRTFAVESQELDGRTLHVRVVPFDEVATVADPPDFRPYKEQFMPGVFVGQENAAHRVLLRTDHLSIEPTPIGGVRKPGLEGVVGKGISLRETSAGVEMALRFLNTREADTARELVEEKAYDSVSAEFAPIRSVRSKGGVMQRVKAHLDSVTLALGGTAAYSGASILALREGVEVVEDEEMMPPPPDRELLERCAALGIALPEGMAKILEPQEDSTDQ